MKKIYEKIALTLQAWENCIISNNKEWQQRHKAILETIMRNGPSGSGIDCGTKLDMEASNPDKLVFNVSFHHMNDGGYYDGWTTHKIIVTPSLVFGLHIRITGRDRNEIKEHLHEVYSIWLQELEKPIDCERKE
jgi:hypothetical protein